MDADLIQVAHTLAERGWLPGIEWDDDVTGKGDAALVLSDTGSTRVIALESDLHLAAHNEIVRRGWSIIVTRLSTSVGRGSAGAEHWSDQPGTTTLSLLRALRAACEAAERNEGVKR